MSWALPADTLTVHWPPLTAMGADLTFVKLAPAGMGVAESVPPHPLAMSCPPEPVAFTHTDSVYVPSGMAATCCWRVPFALSCQDHRPV